MARVLLWFGLALLLLASGCISPAASPTATPEIIGERGPYSVVTSEVEYFDGVSGYLAKPSQPGNYPGIVMIHEWWGLNSNIKEMAEMLASEGYVVLAVDLYDGQVAATPAQALALVSALNQEKAIENMKAAVSYLRATEGVSKVASLGWCFGGGQSLMLSLNERLDATVIYYGHVIVTDESQLSAIGGPVLGVFGAADGSIPVSSVSAFETALDSLGIENEIYVYDGAGHGFANPTGQNYAPEETRDAWEKTLDFLDRNLR